MGLGKLLEEHRKQMQKSVKQMQPREQRTKGLVGTMMHGGPLIKPKPRPKLKGKDIKEKKKTAEEGIFTGSTGHKRREDIRKELQKKGFRK